MTYTLTAYLCCSCNYTTSLLNSAIQHINLNGSVDHQIQIKTEITDITEITKEKSADPAESELL